MTGFASTFYGGSDIYADWRTISIGAAAISILGSAMLIMLSRLFSLRNLEQVAKTEFVYAASTVFIVIMAVGIIGIAEPRLVGLAKSLYLMSFGFNCGSGPPTSTNPNPNWNDACLNPF